VRRADRLFQIVQHLRGGRLVTARQLGESLGVSDRTIYRDIADLSASGVPIEGAAGIGYVLRKGFDLPPLMFTSEEIVALITGARLLRAYGGEEHVRAAEEALAKISAVLPASVRRQAEAVPIHVFPVATTELGRGRFDVINAAIADERRLELTYLDGSGAETQRTVQPLGLIRWEEHWTLVAWCERREDFRYFRVDRISAVERGLRYRPDPSRSLARALERIR
jgi:predicted DNA-binding transcriptional regulator YafY